MSEIKIERNPGRERLDELGVRAWPVWTKEASAFPWSYDVAETCYFIEGDVHWNGAGHRFVADVLYRKLSVGGQLPCRSRRAPIRYAGGNLTK